jgi:1-acyl-sn-glycerol-3-phosphate acyltransferase
MASKLIGNRRGFGMAKIRANILGFLFYFSIGIGLVTVMPPWLLFCFVTRQRTKFTLVCKPFFAVIFFLFGIKIKLEGEIPRNAKKCFVLSNHQSFVDVPAILYKVFPVAFLAKKSLFKLPYFGALLAYTASIPVERGNPQSNAKLPALIRQRLSQGFPIMAFPEGTRSKDGELLPFKSGIFRIIKKTAVPIFPITLVGIHKVMPKTGIALYPGVIKIIPHKIISVEQIKSMEFEELKNLVRERIYEK